MSESTIEISRDVASAIAHYFGFQQWVTPNGDAEYITDHLEQLDAIVRFGEAYYEPTRHGAIEPHAEMLVHALEEELEWLETAFEADHVLGTLEQGDYHPVLVETVEDYLGDTDGGLTVSEVA